MISPAYCQHFVDKGSCPERFVRMEKALGKADAQNPQDFVTALAQLQRACGVDALKLSGYGFRPEEFDSIARNAKETMGGEFFADPCELIHEDCVEIQKNLFAERCDYVEEKFGPVLLLVGKHPEDSGTDCPENRCRSAGASAGKRLSAEL